MLQTLELRQIWLASEKVKHLFGFQAKAERKNKKQTDEINCQAFVL